MGAQVITDLHALKDLVGREVAVTDWLEISQERITRFAELTEDLQWIHLDRERAQKDSPYGSTIAHGFLTLSLLSRFLREGIRFAGGVSMAVNYGLNRVRFPAPVAAGARVRARIKLDALKDFPGGKEATWVINVAAENAEKPSCVAEWVVRYYS